MAMGGGEAPPAGGGNTIDATTDEGLAQMEQAGFRVKRM